MNARIKPLPDLQTERHGLLAMQAKREFEAARDATCSQNDLIAAGQLVRAALLSALIDLPEWLMEAIDGEYDETRLHFLLTDAVHSFLLDTARVTQHVGAGMPSFSQAAAAAMKPRNLMTVSQWADRFRVMKSGTNLPGNWSTANNPPLREIMDSMSEHSPIEEVDFVACAQIGKTEVFYNIIGYYMHNQQNKDMLVVTPSKEFRDNTFNPRLNRTIDESPALKELITRAGRNRKNDAAVLEYGIGAKIIKAGANVAADIGSHPIPIILCDEVDKFPFEIPGFGDPMLLLEGRQTTFSRAKTFRGSTPTVEHTSRIMRGYNKSDRRRYHVPCPHCQALQPLEWGGLKYDVSRHEGQEDVPESERQRTITAIWYECSVCHEPIEEGHKKWMLDERNGAKWIAQRPAVKKHRGYHLNALYAPLGLGKSWKWLAEKWLSIQGDTAALQAFVNERLGEVWTEVGDSVPPAGLIARKEHYLPNRRILARTAWADVQKDRIEFSIVEWGAGEESWLVDHVILPGETAHTEVWEDLEDAWRDLELTAAGVDAGYNTSQVKAFVGGRQWIFATKGVPGHARSIVEDVTVRAKRLRKRRAYSVSIEPIGVDNAKAVIYARLKLAKAGPGYIHFPNTEAFDDEYFQQVTAERLVTKMRGNRPYEEWVTNRARNEALDCLVGNLAVLRLGVNLAKLDSEIAPLPVETTAAGKTSDPLPAKPAPSPPMRIAGRRVSRSPYLMR